MTGLPEAPAVAVVGSLNLDLVVRVARLPGPGETVAGSDVFRNPGGKGANQAVAAARLGGRVAMVGCVGDDTAGRELLGSLAGAEVDTERVRVVDGVPSGTAFITVGDDGENQIVVSPGANARLTAADVDDARPALEAAAVTLLPLEVPLDARGPPGGGGARRRHRRRPGGAQPGPGPPPPRRPAGRSRRARPQPGRAGPAGRRPAALLARGGRRAGRPAPDPGGGRHPWRRRRPGRGGRPGPPRPGRSRPAVRP